MEEDMERLKARRRVGNHSRHHSHSHHRDVASPSGSTFSVESVKTGLGTGVGVRDVLPLKSRFYDWCCEYFKEPQMRVSVFDRLDIAPTDIPCSNRKSMSLVVYNITTKFGASSGTSRCMRLRRSKPVKRVRPYQRLLRGAC